MPSFIPSPMQFKNFNPTPALVKTLKRSFDRLVELSPSDSHVNTVLENIAGIYRCEIQINSSGKKWSVLKASKIPADALMEAMTLVLNDLTAWKKSRFI